MMPRSSVCVRMQRGLTTSLPNYLLQVLHSLLSLFLSPSAPLPLSPTPLPPLKSIRRVFPKGIHVQRDAQHASPDGLLDRQRRDKRSFFLRALRLLQTLRSPPTLQLVPIREGELLSIQGDPSFRFFSLCCSYSLRRDHIRCSNTTRGPW